MFLVVFQIWCAKHIVSQVLKPEDLVDLKLPNESSAVLLPINYSISNKCNIFLESYY